MVTKPHPLLYIFYFLMACAIASCSAASTANPHIVIQTEAGDIEVELYPDKAPKTVAAFLSYVDAGYYKKCQFYRVMRDDNQPSDAPKANLIQGGIWKTNYKLATTLPGIPHEPTNVTNVLHKDGVVSLARMEPGTATTEFFICVGDQPGYDYGGANNEDHLGYAAFGKCVHGMNVVNKIYNRKYYGTSFDPPVTITNVVRK